MNVLLPLVIWNEVFPIFTLAVTLPVAIKDGVTVVKAYDAVKAYDELIDCEALIA
jgi:hypothetical protein